MRTDGKDKLLVAATDLNVTVTAELPCKVVKEGGLTVGAKHLHDIVKALPGRRARRSSGPRTSTRRSAPARSSTRSSAWPTATFPKLPNHREVKFAKVDAATLRDMIAKTFFSISTDETRYHLNGVLFESDGAVARMVSTDGHRLSKVERPLAGGPEAGRGHHHPAQGARWRCGARSRRAEGGVELGIHNGHSSCAWATTALSVKLIDAQFPPYDQVIPKENDKVAIAPRAGAPGGAQAHQHHVVGQDLGHQVRRSTRAS